MNPLGIRSVLVASDLHEGSDAVVATAANLAGRLGAELHVLHAVEFTNVPYSAMSASPQYQRHVDEAREALEAQVSRVLPPGMRTATEKVRLDAAPHAIHERAAEVAADLVVIGPARPRLFRGTILGNTADHVVRDSSTPVLVIRDASALELRRVFVPFSLDDPARGAVDQAFAWAGALGTADGEGKPAAELHLLYVIPSKYEGTDPPFDSVVVRPQLQLEMEDARHRVGAGSEVEVHIDTLWGDAPAEAIVRLMEEDPADLLVMGTHGYGAIGRALIGSVTSRVVRTATCPMLLVPASMWAVESPSLRSARHEASES